MGEKEKFFPIWNQIISITKKMLISLEPILLNSNISLGLHLNDI
jgi:hypothetical protein